MNQKGHGSDRSCHIGMQGWGPLNQAPMETRSFVLPVLFALDRKGKETKERELVPDGPGQSQAHCGGAPSAMSRSPRSGQSP